MAVSGIYLQCLNYITTPMHSSKSPSLTRSRFLSSSDSFSTRKNQTHLIIARRTQKSRSYFLCSLHSPVSSKAAPPTTSQPTTFSGRTISTPAGNNLALSHHAKPLRVQKQSVSSLKAIEKSRESSETSSEEVSGESESEPELTQLGTEIKAAMEEKKLVKVAQDGLFAGVAAEIKEIEWPAFGKVLGTTWVVFGVIAGSSVVLLTLNVVLTELSDKVFAGRGVQDFFG